MMNERTALRFRRACGAIVIVFLCCIAGAVGWFVGMLQENISLTSVDHAAAAMEMTGLSTEYAPGFCLHGFTGFRDYFSQTEFSIEYQDERRAVLDEIAATENWHVMPVTVPEYAEFAQSALWGSEDAWKYAEDIVFEGWYYEETNKSHSIYGNVPEGPMKSIGVNVGRGFKYALYDADTGLFIYINQFG